MSMITSWTIFFLIAVGAICSRYAKQRGRNPVGWFFIGLAMGLLGILLLFILPQKSALATTAGTTINIDEPPVQKKPAPPKTPSYWYYLGSNKTQVGPISKEELQKDLSEGKLSEKTLVWNETLEDWVPYRDL